MTPALFRAIAIYLLLLSMATDVLAQAPPAPLINALTNPGAYYNERFGAAIARVSDDLFAIGTPAENSFMSPPGMGVVWLCTASGEVAGVITNPAPPLAFGGGAYFGRLIVPVGNETVIVSGWRDFRSTDPGVSFLFHTNGTLLATFQEPGGTNTALFGVSVALVGADKVAIGTGYSVHIFNTNGMWLNTITNPAAFNPDNRDFGYAVCAVGIDRIAVRTFDYLNLNTISGFLYNIDGTLLSTLRNFGELDSSKAFTGMAASIAAVGTDRIIIGSPASSGSAYLCDTNGTLLATFFNPGSSRTPNFGRKVAALGTNKVLVAAAGAVYVFELDGTLLSIADRPPANHDFGCSLAPLPGNKFIAGAQNVPTPIYFSPVGAVYTYDAGPDAPTLNITRPCNRPEVRVSWFAPYMNYVLERADHVPGQGETNVWRTFYPSHSNGTNWSDCDINWETAGLFRLRKQ